MLGQSLRLAVIGVMCGLPAAAALTRMMQALLFEVSTTDVRVYAGVAVVFAAVSLMAALVPAWRAVRINPMVALRA